MHPNGWFSGAGVGYHRSMRFGYFLSCEEYSPAELIEQAVAAEEAGFDALWISDHYHPWNDEQGQSPFVWSMIGALSQVCALPVTTAVTCPTIRIHPAVIAQAAATAAVQLEGRFTLGRRHRRGAQRARPRRRRGRRPTSGWRCSRRRSSSSASCGPASR